MARLFTDILRDTGNGQVVDDLTALLADVTKAVEATGKPGSVTLKLKVSPNGDRMVQVECGVSVTTPRPNYGRTMFFTDADGGVHRRDPMQREMTLRRVGEDVNPTSGVSDVTAAANS